MKGAQIIMEEKRSYYLDYLRVMATFAVIVLHVAASNWYKADIHFLEWNIFNFYDSVVRWPVPVFVMISGVLFLNKKEIPLKKLYSKYIFRIVKAFLFWSFFYAVIFYEQTGNIVQATENLIKGHFHLWFLFMIAGLYVIIPFTKKISESDFLTKYFLLLALLFTFLLPQAVKIITIFSEYYGAFAKEVIGHFNFYFVMGFPGYFLLGYILSKIEFTKKQERIIYTLGILGFLVTIIMSVIVSFVSGEASEIFYSSTTVNVLCESVAVFVFFKKKFNRPSKIIMLLSKYSFGAYLIHAYILEEVIKNSLGLNTLSFNPIFSVPVISGLVFIISFAASAILNNVPFLKKHIV